MGSAYKKNYKNLIGNQDITGHDVVSFGLASVPGGEAWSTASGLLDPWGVASFYMPRNGRLEGAVANVSAALTTGQIVLHLLVDGTQVGQTNFTSSNPRVATILLDKENDNDVALSSGSIVTMTYELPAALATTVGLSARVHIVHLED